MFRRKWPCSLAARATSVREIGLAAPDQIEDNTAFNAASRFAGHSLHPGESRPAPETSGLIKNLDINLIYWSNYMAGIQTVSHKGKAQFPKS